MRLNEMDGPSHAAMGGQATGEYDWIDIESMRRTFWVAYTIDRFTSAIDGLPLTFNERHVRKLRLYSALGGMSTDHVNHTFSRF